MTKDSLIPSHMDEGVGTHRSGGAGRVRGGGAAVDIPCLVSNGNILNPEC